MTVNTDQARTADSVMACPPVTASLGLRLIGDEEVATITLTQHDQAVILHCADQAHAARIAAAIEALPAAPAVHGEPVGEVRFELGAPSSIFAELYSKSLPVLAPGTKLYAAPQPEEQKPFEWPLLDAPALIGGVVVGKGCSSGHVVMIAQRKYQYEAEHSPEEHARRKKAFQDALAQIRDGVGQQPDEAWSDDADSDSAAVAEAIRAREEAIAQVSGLQLQVAGLVEALEAIQKAATHESIHTGIQAGTALGFIAAICNVTLAAHRKQGGEV